VKCKVCKIDSSLSPLPSIKHSTQHTFTLSHFHQTMTKNDSTKKQKGDDAKRRRKDDAPTDSDEDFIDDNEPEAEMDAVEYKKFLSSIFPSKHMSKEVARAIEDVKNEMIGALEGETDDTDEELVVAKNNKKNKKNKKKRRVIEEETDEEDEEETDGKVSIVFEIVVPDDKDEYDSEDEDSDDEDSDEDSDDEDSDDEDSDEDSDGESLGSEDSDTETEEESDSSYEPPKTRSKKQSRKSMRSNTPPPTSKKAKPGCTTADTTDKYYDKKGVAVDGKVEVELLAKLEEVVTGLGEGNESHPLVKQLNELRANTKRQIKRLDDKKNLKKKKDNTLAFKRLMRGEDPANDVKFFKEMGVEEQNRLIAQAKAVKDFNYVDKPYSLKLLESDIPAAQKAVAMSKLNTLKYTEPGSSEYAKTKDWLDQFMKIPFGKYNELPVSMEDGLEKCQDFIADAKESLDAAVYGMGDAKMQILQTVGQWVTNPKSIGNALAVGGPPGTGKTTLILQGLAKIMNRPAVMIPLGGAEDGSRLTGHSFTYEGSKPGKIIDCLIQSKCSNPIIYFDEVDKISQTAKGEEIIGILTHLIDSSQNSKFHDDYFSEFDFDLSRCMFVFAWNDISAVNPILRDRMYRIQTKGYEKPEKTIIATDYLLPVIRELVNFKDADIEIPAETIHHLIDTHTEKEEGVRNLKRCLEVIYTKINLYRLIKPDTKMYEDDLKIDVTFPMKVTVATADKLIKKKDDAAGSKPPYGMYV